MSVCSQIRQIFSERLHIQPPADDADLIEAGILDSLTFVELLLSIEQNFGLRIALGGTEVEHFRSIGRIVQFIEASNHHHCE